MPYFIENYLMSSQRVLNSTIIFVAMTSCLDEAVKNVTSALIDASMYENTVIIFSTGKVQNRPT